MKLASEITFLFCFVSEGVFPFFRWAWHQLKRYVLLPISYFHTTHHNFFLLFLGSKVVFFEWNDDISIRLAFSKAKYILHIFQVFCISNFILCICVGNWVKREFPFTFLDDPLRFRSTTFLAHTTETENKELVREKCSF